VSVNAAIAARAGMVCPSERAAWVATRVILGGVAHVVSLIPVSFGVYRMIPHVNGPISTANVALPS
jgi:hypothetical protein